MLEVLQSVISSLLTGGKGGGGGGVTNHASYSIFLLNHAVRKKYSAITRHVKRSKKR